MIASEPDGVVLGDVMRMAFPPGASVQAGSVAQRVMINWVIILTRSFGAGEQIEAGDLVLLPPEIQAEMAEGELTALLQQLAEARSAAVITFLPVSERVMATLAGYEMVVVFSAESTLRQAHKNIATLLTDRQRQISARGMQLYRQLSEMSREGQGLSKMADALAMLTGKIVVVQDKRLEIAAISIPPDSIVLNQTALIAAVTNPENLPPLLRNRKAAAKANKSHWQQLLFPDDNVARLISPIISGDRARGYLSIIGAADDLDVLDAVAAERGADASALVKGKSKEVEEA